MALSRTWEPAHRLLTPKMRIFRPPSVADLPHRSACCPKPTAQSFPALQACSDASFIIPLGLAAPYAWRLVQCIRVYLDTGARPQLFNALKYSTAFPVGAVAEPSA